MFFISLVGWPWRWEAWYLPVPFTACGTHVECMVCRSLSAISFADTAKGSARLSMMVTIRIFLLHTGQWDSQNCILRAGIWLSMFAPLRTFLMMSPRYGGIHKPICTRILIGSTRLTLCMHLPWSTPCMALCHDNQSRVLATNEPHSGKNHLFSTVIPVLPPPPLIIFWKFGTTWYSTKQRMGYVCYSGLYSARFQHPQIVHSGF